MKRGQLNPTDNKLGIFNRFMLKIINQEVVKATKPNERLISRSEAD